MPITGSYYRAFLDPNDGISAATQIGNLFGAAKNTIDIAIYDMYHADKYVPDGTDKAFDHIIPAGIMCAVRRGVNVRIITDWTAFQKTNTHEDASLRANYFNEIVTEAGKSDKLQVMKRYPNSSEKGIMHNKYVIVDNSAVWTGSYNWTTSSFNSTGQANNGILLVGKEIANAFNSDFNGMWNAKKAGGIVTTNQCLRVQDGGKDRNIKIGFSPTDNISQLIISHIKDASTSINVSMFSFTDHELKQALIEKAKKGIKVKVLSSMERLTYNRDLTSSFISSGKASLSSVNDSLIGDSGTIDVFKDLLQNNIEVRFWSGYMMHMKTFTVDDKYIGLGSFNWTARGSGTNDENYIVLDDSDIVTEHNKIFQRMWDTESIILQ